LGVTPPLLKGLWAALAALLHLGQVTYVEKEGSGGGGNLGCDAEGGAEDGDSGDDAGGSGHLAQAAALLGVDSLSLHKALSEHVLGTMGRRTSIQVVQLGKAKAAGNRDALIRLLYAKVFGWVVRVANRAIAGHAHDAPPATGEAALSSGAKRAAQKAAEALQKAQRSLSVLDIYGFEILDVGLRVIPPPPSIQKMPVDVPGGVAPLVGQDANAPWEEARCFPTSI
jgi:myosin heavy subunit